MTRGRRGSLHLRRQTFSFFPSCRFIPAHTGSQRLRHYAKIGLLAVDEVGFLSFDTRNADLFYQFVSRRYERKSLVLTTNLAFNQWATDFPNATCATALIERVVHHADIVTIEGESYRVRESQEEAKKRRHERTGRRRGARDTK